MKIYYYLYIFNCILSCSIYIIYSKNNTKAIKEKNLFRRPSSKRILMWENFIKSTRDNLFNHFETVFNHDKKSSNILYNDENRFAKWLSLAKRFYPENNNIGTIFGSYKRMYEIGENNKVKFIDNNNGKNPQDFGLFCLKKEIVDLIAIDVERTTRTVLTDKFKQNNNMQIYDQFEKKIDKLLKVYISSDTRICSKNVGYVQGMSFVFGNLLLAVNMDEAKTLYLFSILLNNYGLNVLYNQNDGATVANKILQKIILHHFPVLKVVDSFFWYRFNYWFFSFFMKYSNRYVPDIKFRMDILNKIFKYGLTTIYTIAYLYFKEILSNKKAADFCNNGKTDSIKDGCYQELFANKELNVNEQKRVFSNKAIEQAIGLINIRFHSKHISN